MRIIAGTVGGLRLNSPPDSKITRPISDRGKEALFNIIQGKIPGCRFLDIFAGTGSVGIEAVSRGAEIATFVERNPKVCKVLRSNLNKTRLADYAEIRQTDALKYLQTTQAVFDIIFIAPPQYQGLYTKGLQALDQKSSVLANHGLIIMQCDPTEASPLPLTSLKITDTRQYGNVYFTFLRHDEKTYGVKNAIG